MTALRKSVLRLGAVLAVLALLATACGGEVSDDASDDGDDDSADGTAATDDSDDSADGTAATDDSDDSGDDTTTAGDSADDADGDDAADEPAGPNIYEDPRGGIFAEFQATYDRGDHPFTQVDAFCLSHPAAENREDTAPGITADTISLVHIRSRLEDAAAIGFGVPVGDPEGMFETFVDYVNEECGGVRGRQLELTTIEVPLFGNTVDEDRNAACIEATEDHNAVITMNSSGFQGTATLCLVEEQQSAFISTQGQKGEWMGRGEGRLVSLSMTNEESLQFLAAWLLESGALEGKVVGVAAPDTPGQPESVEEGLVQPLRDAGIEVIFDIIGCDGGTSCSSGVGESVTRMRSEEIGAFFNVLNILSAPGYIAEMAAQGFEPGDVDFYASDFNSATSELVSGQIANNPDAGALYNGATMVDYRATGDYRAPDYQPTVWQATCADLYNTRNPDGNSHAWDDLGDSAYGMTASVCSILRIALRALYDAGDNPTLEDVHWALASLGPIDLGPMTPSSILPGKGQSPDALQSMNWEFPCEQVRPYTMANGNKVCVTGNNDWWVAPR